MKRRIIALSAHGVGRTYPLGETTVIGRHPDCDIQIVDTQLSKHHARITFAEDAAHIEDLGSLNGVFVNGRAVDVRHALTPNDVVSLGSYALLFCPNLSALPAAEGNSSVLVTDEDTAALTVTSRKARTDEESPLARRILGRLAEALDGPGDLLTGIVEDIRHRISLDGLALIRGNGDDAEAVYVLSHRSTMSVPRSLLQLATGSREALMVADAQGDTVLSQGKSVVNQEVRSVLVCPLNVGDASFGSVVITRDQPNAYTEHNLKELADASGALALALAQVGGLARLQRRVRASTTHRPTLVGESEAMVTLRDVVTKAAAAGASVLVLGETGVGKELVARSIHAQSPRSDGPFIAVNCGAIPENLVESELFGHEKGAFSGADERKLGQLEMAHGGTLFLDEVGELPLGMQVKLLRALQERSFYRVGGVKHVRSDFRIVAATNRKLEDAVQQGTFREDLYYRLNVVPIDVPPLRQRSEDIEALCSYLIREIRHDVADGASGLTAAALQRLREHRWPGNVRELRNVLERAMVLGKGEEIDVGDLPHDILRPSASTASDKGESAGTLPERIARLEKTMIEEALRSAKGKKTQASSALGISRPTLDRKIAAYDIDIFRQD